MSFTCLFYEGPTMEWWGHLGTSVGPLCLFIAFTHCWAPLWHLCDNFRHPFKN